MKEKIYNLHIESSKIVGREKACGKKQAYPSEEVASERAFAYNAWKNRRHDVEAYPCYFCNMWHIGKIMSTKVIRCIIKGK
jgi:hypothetical protein